MTAAARPTPADLGFRARPEWEPHVATWTGWPFDDDLWEGHLDGVRRDMTGLVATIARFEPVVINVIDDESETDARRRLDEAGVAPERVRYHRIGLDDVWLRDNGPIFVVDDAGRVALTDWEFNGWGGKYTYDTDTLAPRRVAATLGARRFAVPWVMEGGALEFGADGVCLTTRQCLLHQYRNPDLAEDEIERILKANLGVRHVVWLGEGLEGDHTDGHVDTLARFTDARTIVACVEPDPDDANHEPLARNLERLRALRSPGGDPYRLIELPLPRVRRTLGPRRLPLTYANFAIGNGFVAVPTYDDPNDDAALEVLRPLFPEREVIGLPAASLITGGGAFHCVTNHQPAGDLAPPADPAESADAEEANP